MNPESNLGLDEPNLRASDERDLPTGTVTLVLTDIEGSTRLWTERPRTMFQAVSRHQNIIGSVVERYGGRMPRDQGEGDSVFIAFARPSDAVSAAVAVQLAMASEPWPEGAALRVRIAVHTGEVRVADGNYFGPTVNRTARLRALAHGGQTVLSGSTHELLLDQEPPEVIFRDLGSHRLRDFARPEHVWQVTHAELPSDFPALRSNEGRADNLPRQLTSFVGRRSEMAEIKELLAEMRLVTMSGPGGCGKTRLAVEIGRQLFTDFKDGVHLVALAPLSDAALVLPTIAQSVGLQESAGESPFEGLVAFLHDKQMLLVLDNFEGVLEAGGVVADLLSECPDLKVLVTTRASLRLQGEHEYHLPPLALPELEYAETAGDVATNEAVVLFVERARAVRPDFQLTVDNAAAIAEICHRLDGLPLAIELAAVRVKLLPPAALLERLSSRLQLLTGGARDLPTRQQTLRNAIDWDYTLLGAEEQKVFRRLAVCDGGFDLDSAPSIATAAGELNIDVLDGIESLVNKSLVREGRSVGDQPHFEMLQTLREYAQEVLRDSGEEEATRAAHADYYIRIAERGNEQLRGPVQESWLERVDRNHDNFRAALRWLSETGQARLELKLAGAMATFWSFRGFFSEGRRWLGQALAHDDGQVTPERARALNGAATLARARNDFPVAEDALHQSLELHRKLHDRRGIAVTLKDLGNIAIDQGDVDEGKRLYEDSLTVWRQLDDRLGTAQTLNNLGFLAQVNGDQVTAEELLNECLALFRRLEDKQGIARALMNLGVTKRELGDHEEAVRLSRQSLVLWRQLGDKWDVADCLEDMAGVMVLMGDHSPATIIFGAADSLRWAIGAPRPPSDEAKYDHHVELAREALGDAEFAEAWGRGSSMRMEQVIDFALRPDPQAEKPSRLHH